MPLSSSNDCANVPVKAHRKPVELRNRNPCLYIHLPSVGVLGASGSIPHWDALGYATRSITLYTFRNRLLGWWANAYTERFSAGIVVVRVDRDGLRVVQVLICIACAC